MKRKKVFWAIFGVILLHFFISSSLEAEVTFTDVSESAGVNLITPSWGVSWGDVNADGWEDFYTSNHMYHPTYAGIMIPPSLFINQGDGTFQDFGDSYGLSPNGDIHGAMWGDFNNDGFRDLFQAKGSNQGQSPWPNNLYLNKGEEGLFEDIAVAAGLDIPLGRGRGGCWFDYDNDAYLDLYVCMVSSMAGYPGTLFRNRGDGTFEDIGEQAGAVIEKARGCTAVDYNNDGLLDLFVASSNPVNLLKNKGDGVYEDVTRLSFPGERIYTVAFAWGDYDNDGNLDLYLVGSDVLSDAYEATDQSIEYITEASFGSAHGVDFEVSAGSTINFDLYDFQWRLDTNLIFLGRNRTPAPSNPFSLSYNDAGAEGDPNFIPAETTATFIWHENGQWHIRSTNLSTDPSAHFTGIVTTDGQFSNVAPLTGTTGGTTLSTSRLYRNQGDGTFLDTTLSAGLTTDIEGIATTWLDVDNDGNLDLYIVDDGKLYNAPNRLYKNNGDGTFTDIAALAQAEANVQGRGENVAYADYNNDGFLDLFVTNGKGAAPFSFGQYILLRNNGNQNHWLKIRLIGTASNRDGVGAKVTLTANGNTQIRQQTGGVLKYAQNSNLLHFGLGQNLQAQLLEVSWPSGITQTLQNVAADQTIELTEPSVEVTLVPDNTTLFPGDTLEYVVALTNRSSRALMVDVWSHINTPIDQKSMGPLTVYLQPEELKFRILTAPIPMDAPIGDYHYTAFVGHFPSSWIWDSKRFDFSVTLP